VEEYACDRDAKEAEPLADEPLADAWMPDPAAAARAAGTALADAATALGSFSSCRLVG